MPEPAPRDRREGPDPILVSMTRYSGLGLQLAGAIGLFMAAGWWADGKLGTRPLLTIVGALVGMGAGFYSLYLHLVKRPRDEGRE